MGKIGFRFFKMCQFWFQWAFSWRIGVRLHAFLPIFFGVRNAKTPPIWSSVKYCLPYCPLSSSCDAAAEPWIAGMDRRDFRRTSDIARSTYRIDDLLRGNWHNTIRMWGGRDLMDRNGLNYRNEPQIYRNKPFLCISNFYPSDPFHLGLINLKSCFSWSLMHFFHM